MDDFDKCFREVIRCHRKRLGLSQREIGERVFLTHGSVCNIEIGRRKVSFSTARLFAKALGMSLSRLAEEVELEMERKNELSVGS